MQPLAEQHFSNATLELYHSRFFDERSELILAEGNQTLQEMRDCVEACEQWRIVSLQSHWTRERSELTFRVVVAEKSDFSCISHEEYVNTMLEFVHSCHLCS